MIANPGSTTQKPIILGNSAPNLEALILRDCSHSVALLLGEQGLEADMALGTGGDAASFVLPAVAVRGTQHRRSSLPRQLQGATGGAVELCRFGLQKHFAILRPLAELFGGRGAGAGVRGMRGGHVLERQSSQ